MYGRMYGCMDVWMVGSSSYCDFFPVLPSVPIGGGGGWIQTCALALYVWEDVWMYGCMDGG